MLHLEETLAARAAVDHLGERGAEVAALGAAEPRGECGLGGWRSWRRAAQSAEGRSGMASGARRVSAETRAPQAGQLAPVTGVEQSRQSLTSQGGARPRRRRPGSRIPQWPQKASPAGAGLRQYRQSRGRRPGRGGGVVRDSLERRWAAGPPWRRPRPATGSMGGRLELREVVPPRPPGPAGASSPPAPRAARPGPASVPATGRDARRPRRPPRRAGRSRTARRRASRRMIPAPARARAGGQPTRASERRVAQRCQRLRRWRRSPGGPGRDPPATSRMASSRASSRMASSR